jgi:hypothetical protein
LRLPLGQNKAFTLVALNESPAQAATSSRTYRLLGSSFAISDTTYLAQGQTVALTGTFGELTKKAVQGKENNPTDHKYDGFGLHADWVPPFTAELIGGNAEQGSVDRYIALSKEAADEATAAVSKAMEGLIAEQADDQAMAAATQRWQVGMQQEQEKLCGTVMPTCEVKEPRPTILQPEWFPHLVAMPADGCDATVEERVATCNQGYQACIAKPNCDSQCVLTCDAEAMACQATAAQTAIDCLVWEMVDGVMRLTPQMAAQVIVQITAPKQPAFELYSGGSLQQAFIEQWRAVRALDARMEALSTSASAAKARVEAAYAALVGAAQTAKNQCDPNRLVFASNQGLSKGCSGNLTYSPPVNGAFSCSGTSASVTYSQGPYIAQKYACVDAQVGIEPAKWNQVAAYMDALGTVAGAAMGLVDAEAALVASGAQIARLLSEARLAKARVDLEKRLTADGLQTSFSMYRRYRSYDVWRAKALVENARRYALAARRAVEARYVVSLSKLGQPEPFVQSPSTWADEVYGYDLSLPAAVGLAVGAGAEKQGGIYPNKVRDYVANLEAFVMGYSAERPAAVARDDVDVVNLKGLKAASSGVVTDPVPGMTDVGEWSLRCPQADGSFVWVPVPRDKPASQTCQPVFIAKSLTGNPFDTAAVLPDRARMLFSLDPWGRLNGGIAKEPYARRYNGRWGLLAVNFVGTGVKNCDAAKDPIACYGEGFVRYDLSHVGPAWVTDYHGIWRELGVPIGRIEGAKGLAAELWLDPLKHGWSSPYIQPVARTELELRPLGGAYELEFEIGPELDIDKIERVQLLVGSSYWVKQD